MRSSPFCLSYQRLMHASSTVNQSVNHLKAADSRDLSLCPAPKAKSVRKEPPKIATGRRLGECSKRSNVRCFFSAGLAKVAELGRLRPCQNKRPSKYLGIGRRSLREFLSQKRFFASTKPGSDE